MNPVVEFFNFLSGVLGVPNLIYYPDLVRVTVALIVFGVASFYDVFNERKVPPKVWYPAIAVGVILLGYDLAVAPDVMALLPRVAANIALAGAVTLLLGYTHKIPGVPDRYILFGGADMIGLMVISILIPTYPFAGVFPLVRPPVHALRLFFITVVQWTAIVGTVYVGTYTMYLLFRNYRAGDTKLPHALVGTRIPVSRLQQMPNYRVLTDQNGNITFTGVSGKLVRSYLGWRKSNSESFSLSEFSGGNSHLKEYVVNTDFYEEIDSPDHPALSEYEDDKAEFESVLASDSVWVRPDFPFIVVITGGIFCAVIFGSPVYALLLYL